MSVRDAVTALRRFGLGPRPGDLASIASDPRGFLLQSVKDKQAALIDAPTLKPSHRLMEELFIEQREKRMMEQQKTPGPQAQATPPAATADGSAKPPEAAAPAAPPVKPADLVRDVFIEEARQRFLHAVNTKAAFVERLVMFWSSHFCISADKGGPVRVAAGAYEREAIRPHVLGRFRDMLIAVEMHPAMIVYLDNQVSMGPNSRGAKGKGLNENLAREILELHTLGADGGYTQEDVTNFARILTGWMFGSLENALAEPGKFFFAPARHEPGDWTVLGRRYKDEGQLTGQRVLEDLSRHPSTARHIARKLARHFVGENASAELIEKLQKAFRASDGDLAVVSRTLIEAPEAWAAQPAKILPPTDFLIAVSRGLVIEPKPENLLNLGVQLGQPLWRPSSPKGWPDEDNAWTAPSAMRERLRIAEIAARQADKRLDPRALADDLFGEALGEQTRLAVSRAEVREQGIELLLMSPDFQRR